MSSAGDGIVTFICLLSSVYLYRRRKYRNPEGFSRPQAYILRNQVTHARLLPIESKIAFTYTTLSLLVSLDALERHSLDLLGGVLFGYGGIWGRLVGLRSQPYLTPLPGVSIKSKLTNLLIEHTALNSDEELQDAWMMTMPSFLGFEGINPLTVYFWYQCNQFRGVVLEIHNTFGETHVHVLSISDRETPTCEGYDHQWTFPREFHVSPFNDRSGFYSVAVKAPSHSPVNARDTTTTFTPPRPAVSVHLHVTSEADPSRPGPLKLTALLRPLNAIPLSTTNLLSALIRTPFTLLLSMSRIMFIAWKLHYSKRLDVYPRPDPIPGTVNSTSPTSPSQRLSGGTKWLEEGLLEQFCRKKVQKLLQRRSHDMATMITLKYADPCMATETFTPTSEPDSFLTITCLSPRFFVSAFRTPSVQHLLFLNEDLPMFEVSSSWLFQQVFLDLRPSLPTLTQQIRIRSIGMIVSIPSPPFHCLDSSNLVASIQNAFVLYSFCVLEWLEMCIFKAFRVRLVEGQEPWKQWERAVNRNKTHQKHITIGSVRRD